MTTLEYALPIGCTIASGVAAALSRVWATQAREDRKYTEAESASVQQAEQRIDRKFQIVHDLHDCVARTIKAVSEPPDLTAFRAMVARDAKREPTDPTPTVQFDMPATLDPGGRTGEMRS